MLNGLGVWPRLGGLNTARIGDVRLVPCSPCAMSAASTGAVPWEAWGPTAAVHCRGMWTAAFKQKKHGLGPSTRIEGYIDSRWGTGRHGVRQLISLNIALCK